MATDEREWSLVREADFVEGRIFSGPVTEGSQVVVVVPKARAEAAEQCVRELEEQLRDDVRSVEAESSQTLIEVERKLEAKLATAVEALKGVIEAYDDWNVNAYPADGGSSHAAQAWFAEAQRVENAIEQARALSEIEQGDTK